MEKVLLSTLKPHPKNPRKITAQRLNKLKKSITELPKMMEARPLVVDEEGIILGGNMRYKSLVALGYTSIPAEWVKRVSGWSEAEKDEFLIKDNIGAGDWDFTALSEWDTDSLIDWGLEDNKRRKGKLDKEDIDLALDDDGLIESLKLTDKGVTLHKQVFLRYFAAYRVQKGVDIKGIKENVPPARLLGSLVKFMQDLFGNPKDIAIVTTPARNSTVKGARHFATECAQHLSAELRYKFYEGVFVNGKNKSGGTNRQKMNTNFEATEAWEQVKEPIVIVFDDVITTGKTLMGLEELLRGRNVFYFILMNNN